MNRRLKNRLLFALALLLLIIVFGTVGYVLIEDYSWLEALYMTIITMATVGFQEVRPLSDAGRIYTIVLIVTNLGTFAYSISVISAYFMEGDFFKNYKHNKMKKRIAELSGHVIVCGFGRNGREVCYTLKRKGIDFVVIEKNKSQLEEAQEAGELIYIEDDATHEHVLKEAGIGRARALITALPDDAANVFVVLSARELKDNLLIISRASNDTSVSKLRRAGANNIIMPDKIGGAHMASLVSSPDVKEFIDIISGQEGSAIQIEEMSLLDFQGKWNGLSIKDLNIRHMSGVNVIGLKLPDGQYVVNPEVNYPLTRDMKLILLGTREQMDRLRTML